MTICWYKICDELTTWLNWSIISSTSSKLKSMTKKSNLKNLKFCSASRICDELTTWLTEIEIRVSNSNWSQKSLFWTNWILCWICDETSFWLINWQNSEKIFLFVCCSSSFLNRFSIFSSKYDFFAVSRRFALSSVYFLRASRWRLWMYKEKCYWYNEENVFSKSSRVKNWEFEYWWSWCLMTQYWLIWLSCFYCSNWNDQRYVSKKYFLDVFLLDDLNLIDSLKQAELVDLISFFFVD